ncbi:MAG: hypothetical protein L0Z62_11230 [Gemmataceae bacterium]|nr:hypothetical protein [Gemmataceae bacterium]
MSILLIMIVGGGFLIGSKYANNRPVGVSRVRPSSGFGSRATDFADPNKTTLRAVSEHERRQGVQPNVAFGGRR